MMNAWKLAMLARAHPPHWYRAAIRGRSSGLPPLANEITPALTPARRRNQVSRLHQPQRWESVSGTSPGASESSMRYSSSSVYTARRDGTTTNYRRHQGGQGVTPSLNVSQHDLQLRDP